MTFTFDRNHDFARMTKSSDYWSSVRQVCFKRFLFSNQCLKMLHLLIQKQVTLSSSINLMTRQISCSTLRNWYKQNSTLQFPCVTAKFKTKQSLFNCLTVPRFGQSQKMVIVPNGHQKWKGRDQIGQIFHFKAADVLFRVLRQFPNLPSKVQRRFSCLQFSFKLF